MLNQAEASSVAVHPLWLERNKRNLTQRMLADFAQVGEATIQRAERGEGVSIYVRQQLCEFFGKSAQELGLAFARKKGQSKKAARLATQGQQASC
jgi:transcriptional regulator with XRE-family HTH domain